MHRIDNNDTRIERTDNTSREVGFEGEREQGFIPQAPSWSKYDGEEYALRVARITRAFTVSVKASSARKQSDEETQSEVVSLAYSLEEIPTYRLEQAMQRAEKDNLTDWPITAGQIKHAYEACFLSEDLAREQAQNEARGALALPAPMQAQKVRGPKCSLCRDAGWVRIPYDPRDHRYVELLKCSCDQAGSPSGTQWL